MIDSLENDVKKTDRSISGRPLQIGVIGAGAWTAEIATCLSEMRNVKLAAISNRTIQKARDLAAKFGIPQVFNDHMELCVLPGLDAVIVVTHESAHVEATLAALRQGKDVFVEKPMADSSAGAWQMVQCARETGRILMPGHILRFEPRCQQVKAWLSQAGPVRAIRCVQLRPKSSYATYCKPHIAFSLMIHHLDLCRWFVGARIIGVDCRERFFQGADYPSCVWVTLEFEGGAVATLQSGWVFDSEVPCFAEDTIELITDKKRISLDFAQEGLESRTGGAVVRPSIFLQPTLRAELEYRVRCVESGCAPAIIRPEDGAEAVEMAEQVVSAGRKRKTQR